MIQVRLDGETASTKPDEEINWNVQQQRKVREIRIPTKIVIHLLNVS